jgi:hypothetical protein
MVDVWCDGSTLQGGGHDNTLFLRFTNFTTIFFSANFMTFRLIFFLKVAVFMGRSGAANCHEQPKHLRHSMVLVPMDTPGVRILRHLRVMGFGKKAFDDPFTRKMKR